MANTLQEPVELQELRSLCAAAEGAGLPLILLRGHETPEALARSADIDIYVPPLELEKFESIAFALGWKKRRWQIGRKPHLFYDKFHVHGAKLMTLDLSLGLFFGPKLLALKKEGEILRDTQKAGGIFFPHPQIGFFLLALHLLLDKETVSPESRKRALALWSSLNEADRNFKLPAELWGEKAKSLCLSFGKNLADVSSTLPGLKMEASILPCLQPNGTKAFFENIFYPLRYRLWQFFGPRLRIVFVGPDGGGKSTLIGHCKERWKQNAAAVYLGLNQFQTPAIKWLARRRESHVRNGRPLSHPAFVLNRVLWNLCWPAEVLRRVALAERHAQIIFMDRHPAADPKENAKAGLMGTLFRKWLTAMQRFAYPKADILIFCDGEPDLVWKRKQEYSFEKFIAVRGHYQNLTMLEGGQSLWLDSGKELESCLRSICQFTAEHPKFDQCWEADAMTKKSLLEAATSLPIKSWQGAFSSSDSMSRCFVLLFSLLGKNRRTLYALRYRNDQWDATPLRNLGSLCSVAKTMLTQKMKPRFMLRNASRVFDFVELEDEYGKVVGNFTNASVLIRRQGDSLKYQRLRNDEFARAKALMKAERWLEEESKDGRHGFRVPLILEESHQNGVMRVGRSWIEARTPDIESPECIANLLRLSKDLGRTLRKFGGENPETAKELSIAAYVAQSQKSGGENWIRNKIHDDLNDILQNCSPGELRLAHGDFWHGNIGVTGDSFAVFDWDRLSEYPEGYDQMTFLFNMIASWSGHHPAVENGNLNPKATLENLWRSKPRAVCAPLLKVWQANSSMTSEEENKLEAWYFAFLALHAARCQKENTAYFLKAPAFMKWAKELLAGRGGICRLLRKEV